MFCPGQDVKKVSVVCDSTAERFSLALDLRINILSAFICSSINNTITRNIHLNLQKINSMDCLTQISCLSCFFNNAYFFINDY